MNQHKLKEIYTRLSSMLLTNKDEFSSPMSSVNTEDFFEETIFKEEINKIFLKKPLPILALGQLQNDGDFITKTILERPLLILRDASSYRVFLNVCRHRGAKLVSEPQGSQCRGIPCPYHGWTYDLNGRLKMIPEESRGFPGLDKDSFNLKEIKSFSKAGFLWVCFDDDFDRTGEAKRHFSGIYEELDEYHFEDYTFFDCKIFEKNFNWKVAAHAFLEGYHFATTHQNTAAKYYVSNRFLIDIFEQNFRFILPRQPIGDLIASPNFATEDILKHVTILYAVFPNTFLFWLYDHLTCIHFFPISAEKTRVECYVLLKQAPSSAEEKSYFELNKNMFYKITEEDLKISEGIQAGFASRLNKRLTLGSFESCIGHFQDSIHRCLQEN